MNKNIKPSELRPGDVIDWTARGEVRYERQLVLEPRPPVRGQALVTNNGMHPAIWIHDMDAERLAITVHPQGVVASPGALARLK